MQPIIKVSKISETPISSERLRELAESRASRLINFENPLKSPLDQVEEASVNQRPTPENAPKLAAPSKSARTIASEGRRQTRPNFEAIPEGWEHFTDEGASDSATQFMDTARFDPNARPQPLADSSSRVDACPGYQAPTPAPQEMVKPSAADHFDAIRTSSQARGTGGSVIRPSGPQDRPANTGGLLTNLVHRRHNQFVDAGKGLNKVAQIVAEVPPQFNFDVVTSIELHGTWLAALGYENDALSNKINTKINYVVPLQALSPEGYLGLTGAGKAALSEILQDTPLRIRWKNADEWQTLGEHLVRSAIINADVGLLIHFIDKRSPEAFAQALAYK